MSCTNLVMTLSGKTLIAWLNLGYRRDAIMVQHADNHVFISYQDESCGMDQQHATPYYTINNMYHAKKNIM